VTTEHVDGERVRDALTRQWREIARAIPSRDLETASRVEGWRNREVVAHLAMQPVLLVRFLATSGSEPPRVRVADNLAGTRNLAELVDGATREAAANGKIDFAGAAEHAIGELAAADLSTTITTLQGPILLRDYLVTRCVEAVVHGGDLVDPVEPDRDALEIVAAALTTLLATRDPGLVATAAALPRLTWVAVATGRTRAPDPLRGVVPLMS
jgi:Mycothiol maleylpyruvate isomerase N-terminal domain